MTYLAPRRAKPSQGFTLTELAIVMGVIGTILGGIWAAAATVRQNSLVTREQQDLMMIVKNVRSAYANRGFVSQTGTWTDVTTSLVSAKIFPPDLSYDGNGYPLDREGGEIKVEFPANSTYANTDFEIEFMGTPKTCVQLAGLMANSPAVGGATWIFTPITQWKQANGNNLDAGDFVGCTYVSFTFQL